MTAGVVVGVDGSAGAADALRWAREEARVRDLPLTAVLAWGYLDQHHPGGGREFDSAYGEADAEAALTAAVDEALGADGSSVHRVAVCDLPARALLDAGAGAELLVVGARGLGGFKGLLLGSTSQHVLHHATTPVAVVRTPPTARGGRVAVGVDGSAASVAAMRWSVDEAVQRRVQLTVVHAWHVPYLGAPIVAGSVDPGLFEQAARETLADALDGVDVPDDLSIEHRVVQGSAALALLDAGREADVLVVGNHGLGAFAGMLVGSVTQQVARHAECPVVVVPAPRA